MLDFCRRSCLGGGGWGRHNSDWSEVKLSKASWRKRHLSCNCEEWGRAFKQTACAHPWMTLYLWPSDRHTGGSARVSDWRSKGAKQSTKLFNKSHLRCCRTQWNFDNLVTLIDQNPHCNKMVQNTRKNKYQRKRVFGPTSGFVLVFIWWAGSVGRYASCVRASRIKVRLNSDWLGHKTTG